MEEEILRLLNQGITHFEEIQRILKVNKKLLLDELDELVEKGIIYHKTKGIFGIIKIGTLDLKASGYGFLLVDGEEQDYFANKDQLEGIFDGDQVSFYPYRSGSKLLNADIIRVVERGHTHIIGTYKKKMRKGKEKAYIVSTDPKFPIKAIVKKTPYPLEENCVVYGKLSYVGTAIETEILEMVGHKDDPGIEISQIALEYGFRTEFPMEVLEQISHTKEEVQPSELVGRRDFRDRLIFTIDGDDSKDFDDAVDIIKNPDGSYELGVYIADVAEYVKENTPLDKEALSRGTSVYLADRVIPMLPHKLSNGICSLNEQVDRLVLACLMTISKEGNLLNYDICEGVIRSKHRMTYKKVNEILKGNLELCQTYSILVEPLQHMEQLSKIIRRKRLKKGGLEFEVKEYKFKLNEDGSPNQILPIEREEGEKLIEDFMLMANETVAYHLNIMNLPCIYRVHEKPEQEKLYQTFGEIQAMGISVDYPKKGIFPKQIQEMLNKIEDSPHKPILNQLLLRSMMKAKYYESCLGHYGLAMQYYCHFTSPIRRYPDLLVHRILKNVLLHPKNLEQEIEHFTNCIPEIAKRNSVSERKAVDCERAVNDMLYAWYMENHIHTQYQGVITSVTSFGLFVTLDNGVEGLVSLENMQGYYTYFENSKSYSNGKYTYKLGQEVDVVVIGANRTTRKIDFMFVNDYNHYEE